MIRLRRFACRLPRLARDNRAVALTEFALSLPVLLALGLYGIETANYAIANLRISQMAALTADNAGRVQTSIDETNVNELMTGAKMTGTSIGFAAHGRIILSDVEMTSDGKYQWIRWQRCSGAKNVASSYGVPLTSSGATISNATETTTPSSETKFKTTAVGPTGNQIGALANTAVMFVEVQYDYQPIVSNSLLGTRVISYTSAFNVRQRTNQVITNTTNLASSARSACNVFSA